MSKENQSKLKTLEEALSPEKTNEIVDKHEDAYTSYVGKVKKEYSKFSEFQDEIVNYVKAHMKATKGNKVSTEEAYGTAIGIINQTIGTTEEAYNLARKGQIKQVLGKLKETFAKQHASNHRETTLDTLIDPTDFVAQKKLMQEYIERCKAYMGVEPTVKAEELVKEYKGKIINFAAEVYEKKQELDGKKRLYEEPRPVEEQPGVKKAA